MQSVFSSLGIIKYCLLQEVLETKVTTDPCCSTQQNPPLAILKAENESFLSLLPLSFKSTISQEGNELHNKLAADELLVSPP